MESHLANNKELVGYLHTGLLNMDIRVKEIEDMVDNLKSDVSYMKRYAAIVKENLNKEDNHCCSKPSIDTIYVREKEIEFNSNHKIIEIVEPITLINKEHLDKFEYENIVKVDMGAAANALNFKRIVKYFNNKGYIIKDSDIGTPMCLEKKKCSPN